MTEPLDENQQNYEFFRYLTESNLFKNTDSFRYTDMKGIANMMFLYLIGIQIMKSDFNAYPDIRRYVASLNKWGSDFHEYRIGENDLYQLLHVLTGQNIKVLSQLRNQHASTAFYKKLKFDKGMFLQWIRMIVRNEQHNTPMFDLRFFAAVQNQLCIDEMNFRNMRQMALDWSKLSTPQRKDLLSRLLNALRRWATGRSEMFLMIERFVNSKKYELAVSTETPAELTQRTSDEAQQLAAAAHAFGLINPWVGGAGIGTTTRLNNFESASGGSTSAGNISSVNQPFFAGVIKREPGSVYTTWSSKNAPVKKKKRSQV